MNHRERIGLAAAPFFLRVGLGITFVWAGLGKVLPEMQVQGEDAAILASLGVVAAPAKGTTPGPVPSPATIPVPAGPDVKPSTPGPTQPLPVPTERVPAKTPVEVPKSEPEPRHEPKAPPPPKHVATRADDSMLGAPAFVLAQAAAARFTAADFVEPVSVKRVHFITLMVYKAANPGVGADGKAGTAIWPSWAASDRWPVLLAWAAAVTELVGGAFVLLGFLTRFWSLALTGTIVVAAWLTHFGPAIQSGDAILGFLPNAPRFDIRAWQTLLWQLMLAMSGLALFFAGPGAMSLDRLLFGAPPVGAGPTSAS